MTRNLKFLGTAFVAVLAFCAISAPGASAKGEFTSAKTPVVLTGVKDNKEEFRTTAGNFECPNALYEGTVSKSPTTAITVTPTYGHCFTGGGLINVEVDANGCDYLLTIDPLSEKTEGWVDVVCPTGKDITVTANVKTGVGTIKCTVHVPPQTVGGITYTNKEEGGVKKVTLDIKSTGMTFTHTTGTGLGACAGGGATETHNGEYEGNVLVSGFEDTGPSTEEKHNSVPVNIDIG